MQADARPLVHLGDVFNLNPPPLPGDTRRQAIMPVGASARPRWNTTLTVRPALDPLRGCT